MEFIGVDIGGTNIKAGNVVDGKILKKHSIAVNRESSEEKILNDLFLCIDQVITNKSQKIGVGVPGIVDPSAGIVYDIQNIPSWKEVPLTEIISQHYNLPVFINNDANCFAMGEKLFGIGKNFMNFIGLSLGTGVGMGIVINGKLYNGVLCGAGEIGMLPYKEGILEEFTGSFFFQNRVGGSAKKNYELALVGDQDALEVFKDYGYHIGELIKIILYLYAPETIIIGGSISKAYPFYKDMVESSLKTFPYPKQLEGFQINISQQSDTAILGAAALCV
ncbi:ROK family protein [Salegentibacter mishustinae]|jgi:glucokinase|uniref:ROK family protein n=1 Tax=Autumnicola patrickiae TaxID=3075591 RepID=A0ABU3E0W6_9FLAO|nr:MULTISPECIES: ROK family protein [Salegentibacter]MDT0689598.1 ROK family protein [Salegentibacter sp. F188]UBZ05618.1 ROK family protein [Salegentibacter mishustinae]|tara:strand:- start:212 stop:1042 length:831 start_codon:yes stop_codon:yes gene_type:complete